MSVILTPVFLAVALNAAARSQVSRTAFMPCSVKCMVVVKVAIAELPPGETVMCGGILSRLPGPGVRWRPAEVGPALATPAAFEIGRQPLNADFHGASFFTSRASKAWFSLGKPRFCVNLLL